MALLESIKQKENFGPIGKLGGTERKVLGEIDCNLKEETSISNPSESKALQNSQFEVDDLTKPNLHLDEEVPNELFSAQEILRSMSSSERDHLLKALSSIMRETK